MSGVPDPVGPPPALPPYGHPPWPVPDRRSGTPGWLLPLLVVAALVTGLVGGVLGGALVLGSSGSGADLLPSEGDAAPPLAEGGSVAAVAQRVLPSTVQVRVVGGDGSTNANATGSGFAVDDKGHVITNNHVVEVAGADGTITVVDARGRVHRAELIGRSPVYDIAVLDVRAARGLRPAALGSSRRMNVGDTVVAIGSPLGLRSTVTSGIVSALDRPVTTGGGSADDDTSFINAVQTDAAINPGNSGGPLVDLAGRVVGVNSAIATTGNSLGGQGGSIGVGFAIPMEQVRVTANQILRTGEAEYPVIGATVDTGASSQGAVVTEVPEGTPAAAAGLRVGDRIVSVDGVQVADGVALIVAIRSHRPGQRIELTLVRDGAQRRLEVTLDAQVG